tara:strand:+ start:1029 stop:1676 length:648 start_codon:yes stop_codon:yes gene_type:complete
MWSSRNTKKRKLLTVLDEEDDGLPFPPLSFPFPKKPSASQVEDNRIHFSEEVNGDSMSDLKANLRSLERKLLGMKQNYRLTEDIPIYLYLNTPGGSVYDALSVVDTIKQLKVPVYTVVEGLVASAGTLLSLSGEKRYIQPNAYMLIHEIRSSCWGRMSEITDEYENLSKMTKQLIDFYVEHTKMNRKEVTKVLGKDITWNAQECIKKGVADVVFQ